MKEKRNYMTDFTCLCEKVKDFNESCEMKSKYQITSIEFIFLEEDEIKSRCNNVESVFDLTDYSKNNYSKVWCFIEKEKLYVASDGVIVLTKGSTLFGDYTSGNKEYYFNHNIFIDVEEINFSNIDTSELYNMDNMFISLKKLKSLDLSNFDTRNVKSMSGMFSHCESLEEINLKNFNTQKVKNMDYMFSNCENLKKLDLSNFKTNSLMYMNEMFRCCFSLEHLDLSNFSFDKIKLTKVSGRGYPSKEIFNGLSNNTKIVVKNLHEKRFILSSIKSNKQVSKTPSIFNLFAEEKTISEKEKNNWVKSIMRTSPSYPTWNDDNFIVLEK